jgi:hypothetical protein
MKFLCLGYYDESSWAGKSEAEIQAFMDACFAYDLELRKTGHWAGGEALTSVKDAATIRVKNGKPAVTDGPFTETKEQIGGILFLEARDRDHAIALISKHPGIANGPFEIRPVDEKFPAVFAQWVESKKK